MRLVSHPLLTPNIIKRVKYSMSELIKGVAVVSVAKDDISWDRPSDHLCITRATADPLGFEPPIFTLHSRKSRAKKILAIL
jgi:hypothetical protein